MPDLAGKKTVYYGFTGLIEPASATRIASAFNHASIMDVMKSISV